MDDDQMDRFMRRYILRGREIVATDGLLTWANWMQTADRHVAKTDIDGIWVSTVFLGLDHRFSGVGPPILFETMVFDKNAGKDRWIDIEGYFARYSTFDEAEQGHAKIVARVREAMSAGESMLSQVKSNVPSDSSKS